VPGAGFEPATNGLQNRCSTTELTRQIKGLADLPERFWHRIGTGRLAFVQDLSIAVFSASAQGAKTDRG
jgi:hypothetical protein